MADGIEEAAQAFDAVIQSEPGAKTAVSRARSEPKDEKPSEAIFKNVGQVEVDEESPAKGGGDDEPDPEVALYGDKKVQAKGDPRNPRKGDREDGEGDDDEQDGDDPGGDEDDSEDDGDASDPDAEGEEAELQRKVEVTVDGEPVEVTLKEALEGYVRTETFHRRMNQLDEAKKIVRRAAADAVHNFEYSRRIATEMEEHMKTMIPDEPDWDAEFAKDPVKARELQRYYDKAKAFRADLREKMAETQKKQSEADQTQLAAFVEEETLKFDQMNRKNWSDPKRKVKDLQSMRRTAISAGFSEEEVSKVYDSRMLQVLLKASKYDRMMAAKPKPVLRPAGKPISPGAGSAKQRTAQRGASSAMKRLNRTGSVDDAALVFDQIIARN